MSNTIHELQLRLTMLRRRREETERAIAEVRDLLAKADTRRRAEPQNQRKWNAVLDNLELSLDEAKARHEAVDAELSRLEQSLQTAQDLAAGQPREAAGASAEREGALPPANSAEQELLTAQFDQLGKFSLEQISLIQSHLMEQSAEENPETEHLLGRLELANQVREEAELVPAPEEPQQNCRRQLVLRAAIDKIQSNRIDEMTADEVRLVISCHSLLTRRLRPSPKDERLIRILGAAIKVLQRKHAESRKLA